MRYLHQRTQEVLAEIRRSGKSPNVIDDLAIGSDYLGPALDGHIKENYIVPMMVCSSTSTKTRIAGCIYGSLSISLPTSEARSYVSYQVDLSQALTNQKNLDSFLYVGMHHLSALQKEGLQIWGADSNMTFRSDLYLLYLTADGLVYWDGMVGHSGKNGCRLYCGLLGRQKTGGRHYYPALIKPRDQCAAGSDHADINAFDLSTDAYAENLMYPTASPNQARYEAWKTETGITKPPRIPGLPSARNLGVPYSMTTDIMHLAANISDLLISLWRGSMTCDDSGDSDTWDWAVFADERVWSTYGTSIHAAGSHLPGTLRTANWDYARDRAMLLVDGCCTPRCDTTTPTPLLCWLLTKLSASPPLLLPRRPTGTPYSNIWYPASQYCRKVLMGLQNIQFHTFGLGPILLYNILPNKYFENYCKLVRGFQIMCQHRITAEDLVIAQSLLCHWERGFEDLYYRYQEARLHFVRACGHQVGHLTSETIGKGPAICYAQWTMDRTIGNLGQEIRQPSHPYPNLAQKVFDVAGSMDFLQQYLNWAPLLGDFWAAQSTGEMAMSCFQSMTAIL